MREYSCTEIGMLAGTAIGGALAVVAFSIYNNALFLIITIIGTIFGLLTGKRIDKKFGCKQYEKKELKLK